MLPSDRLRIPTHVRTLWLSDVHLGYPGARAEALLEFIRVMRCDTLYLVGDIIDFWSLKKRRHWPQAHNDVVRSILGKAKHDTRVVYVPGNHDDVVRDYVELKLGNVEIHERIIHETVDGRTLLVMHGDQFDAAVLHSRLAAAFGAAAYDGLMGFSRLLDRVRDAMGREHWSLAGAIKSRIGRAQAYIERFENAAVREARRHGVDGLVCGHIHRPALRAEGETIYMNCGDWVENCTALVEHRDGRLQLLRPGAAEAPVEHELARSEAA
ncbi:UDP-2,3-diacylglucosamine diphosphatase [Wenzhouxiangella sp. XN79A]|uniref:UDP-2,3-diacylglucosamine diphosphatase n=1 Tax=Wenzhouxiangella sp. XN79A TaxID=2724193 RepID=UPI00144AD113|nr:UDP-2,3-diacylglucosamine diphosphatase [Wenzhouxiangella sp. XN79A]NKI35984.1 UDP-2,3-diacylglucosamine diphosphatase [Wenzhouxiangella sp. XN79A]